MPVSKAASNTIWEVPGYFSGSVTGAMKGLSETAISIVSIIGTIFETGSYFKPFTEALAVTSKWFGFTKFIANAVDLIPDQNGQIKAFKDCGNKVVKGISVAATNIADLTEAVMFLDAIKVFRFANLAEKFGHVPVLGAVLQVGLKPIKNIFTVLAASTAIIDSGISIHKVASTMAAKKLVLNPLSGIQGKGWIQPGKGSNATEKDRLDAVKKIRDTALVIAKSALKIALVALSVFGWALHPILGFVGLAYGVVSITASVLKAQEKKPSGSPALIEKEWQYANALPVKA